MAQQAQESFLANYLSERRKIIIATNIVMCAVGLIFSAFKISAVGTENFPYPAMLVALFTLVNSIYLLRGGPTQNGVIALLLMLFLGIISSGLYTGAFQGATLILAPILPMLAILWRSTLAGWVMMAAIGVSLMTLYLLQLNGMIPNNVHNEAGLTTIRFFAVSLTSLVCTWVAWTFARYHNELQKINQRQATTDHLTGIANRRSIERAMLREIGRARRSNSWLTFVIADVDHFKRYNDVNGHLEGDRCLVQVAEVFSECATRSSDLVGRFGGEEFIMLLPDTDPEGGKRVAENTRKAMLARDLPYSEDSPDRVSLTLGVISIQGKSIKSPERIIKLADQALYDGKARGRNCVVPVIESAEATPSPMLVASS